MNGLDTEVLSDRFNSPEIRVLHVDDEPGFAELSADLLKKENPDITVKTETSTENALDCLKETNIDCIVSDFDMPDMNGLEFLERVREEHSDLPFILFTGKGSEEIAADAISAGVTDYLQKAPGAEQYTVLANRITNAVNQYRTQQRIEVTREWYQRILQHSSDYVMIVDGNGTVQHVTPPIKRVMGYQPEEAIGTDAFEFVHPEDLEPAVETLSEIAIQPDHEQTVEFRAQHKEGEWRWLEVRGRNLLDNPVIEGVLVNVRDITDRKEREQVMERQKDRLESLSSFLSHDMRNQLNLILTYLDMTGCEDSEIQMIQRASGRLVEMVDRFAELAEKGQIPTTTEPNDLNSLVEDCWERLQTENADLQIGDTVTINGDQERLRSLFENLLGNAVEHAGSEVTIRVGPLNKSDGFYVEDNGLGIPDAHRESIFEPGYTTTEDGGGFGLAIVKYIAEAHGWTVNLVDDEDKGTRFEFTGLTGPPG